MLVEFKIKSFSILRNIPDAKQEQTSENFVRRSLFAGV
jgi:hypothetical protein